MSEENQENVTSNGEVAEIELIIKVTLGLSKEKHFYFTFENLELNFFSCQFKSDLIKKKT